MDDELQLEDGDYPFIAEWLPLSDLSWIEVPANLETLLRDQAHANGVQLIRGRPIELRCQIAEYSDAVFMIFWPYSQDRLHMLAPKKFQMGRA